MHVEVEQTKRIKIGVVQWRSEAKSRPGPTIKVPP